MDLLCKQEQCISQRIPKAPKPILLLLPEGPAHVPNMGLTLCNNNAGHVVQASAPKASAPVAAAA